jgi:hypothetical protein
MVEPAALTIGRQKFHRRVPDGVILKRFQTRKDKKHWPPMGPLALPERAQEIPVGNARRAVFM